MHEFLSNYGWAVWLFVGLIILGIYCSCNECPKDGGLVAFTVFSCIVVWPVFLGALIGEAIQWMAASHDRRHNVDNIKPDPIDHFSGHGGG